MTNRKQAEVLWFSAQDGVGMAIVEGGKRMHLHYSMFACIDQTMYSTPFRIYPTPKDYKRLSDLVGRMIEVELMGSESNFDLRIKKVYMNLLALQF